MTIRKALKRKLGSRAVHGVRRLYAMCPAAAPGKAKLAADSWASSTTGDGMECSKTFLVVFLGLILMTAGFFLTMAGWFAPLINRGVYGVRLAGPVALLLGLTLLLCSCLMCAVLQGRCCAVCVNLFQRKKSALAAKLSSIRTIHHDQLDPCANTFVNTALGQRSPDTPRREAEYVFDANSFEAMEENGYFRGQHCSRPMDLQFCEDPNCVMVNASAREAHESPRHDYKRKKKVKRHRLRKKDSSPTRSPPHRAVLSPICSPPASSSMVPRPQPPHHAHCCEDIFVCENELPNSTYVPPTVTPPRERRSLSRTPPVSPLHQRRTPPSSGHRQPSPNLGMRTVQRETQINGDSGPQFCLPSPGARSPPHRPRGPGLAQSCSSPPGGPLPHPSPGPGRTVGSPPRRARVFPGQLELSSAQVYSHNPHQHSPLPPACEVHSDV